MAKRPDPFNSPKRRLARAKQHIRRLEKRIQTFLKKEPYFASAEVDAEGVTTHALKFTRKVPDSWADAAVEVKLLRPLYDREKHEIPIAKVGPGGEFKYDASFTFSVFLDEFNGVKRAPVVGALSAIANEVQRVLMATETECRRIGLMH